MQTELDIVVLILLVGFALWGRGRGFIKTCLGFIPLLGGVIAAKAFSPALAKVLYHTALSGHMDAGSRCCDPRASPARVYEGGIVVQ